MGTRPFGTSILCNAFEQMCAEIEIPATSDSFCHLARCSVDGSGVVLGLGMIRIKTGAGDDR